MFRVLIKGHVFHLSLVFLLSLGLSVGTSRCYAADQTARASTIDPDGDDERTELLYHWQDKRFSDEERHQITGCTVLVAALFIGGAAKRRIKLNKGAK